VDGSGSRGRGEVRKSGGLGSVWSWGAAEVDGGWGGDAEEEGYLHQGLGTKLIAGHDSGCWGLSQSLWQGCDEAGELQRRNGERATGSLVEEGVLGKSKVGRRKGGVWCTLV
jgi:hypothetical protein